MRFSQPAGAGSCMPSVGVAAAASCCSVWLCVVLPACSRLCLQAENEVEQQEWMQMLQGVIACLLTGAVDHDKLPTRPVRPTHSRT